MRDKREVKSPDRRRFFTKAGLGVGAAGAVAIGLTSGTAKAAKSDPGLRKGGYRETDHVRRFYELSRF